jgi:branched-chain amino acid transport system permease protein
MALCALVGFTIERLAYKPLRKAPRLNVLITAIGVSLFLQNTGNSVASATARPASRRCCPTQWCSRANVNFNLLDIVGVLC